MASPAVVQVLREKGPKVLRQALLEWGLCLGRRCQESPETCQRGEASDSIGHAVCHGCKPHAEPGRCTHAFVGDRHAGWVPRSDANDPTPARMREQRNTSYPTELGMCK